MGASPLTTVASLDIYAQGSYTSCYVYVFCHVMAGLLLGLAFYAWKRDRLLVPACVSGALLPDLIDKPLGLLLAGTVGYGRIYAHTLLFVVILLAAGTVVWRWLSRGTGFLVLALAAGVLSHQILDAMWLEQSAWFWPVLGPFPPPDLDVPILPYFLADLLQPAEWLFAASSLFVAALFLGKRGRWQRIGPALSLLMAVFSMWVFLSAATGSPSVITGWDDRGDNVIVAVMLLAGAAGVDRAGAIFVVPG